MSRRLDSLYNWSTNCSFTVTVVDALPPVINCPSNITVAATCTNVPVFYTPTASDACCGSDVTVVATPPSGSYFAPGTTTPVNVVATDCNGNTNSCTFTVTVPLGANCCPTTNSLVLNTGFNQSSNTVYGYGQADAYWWVSADPVPSAFLPRPATVIQGNPAWQPPQANSQWISSYPTEADNLNGEYDFETFFCVATNGATNLVLNICLRADDEAGAYLNGNLITLTPPNTTFGAPNPACGTVNIQSWFRPGLNVVKVRVTNVYAVAMGLNAEVSVTGTGLIAVSAPCCHPNSGISGQKFFDLNNNGVRDAGEPALSGWTIHLSNGDTASHRCERLLLLPGPGAGHLHHHRNGAAGLEPDGAGRRRLHRDAGSAATDQRPGLWQLLPDQRHQLRAHQLPEQPRGPMHRLGRGRGGLYGDGDQQLHHQPGDGHLHAAFHQLLPGGHHRGARHRPGQPL